MKGNHSLKLPVKIKLKTASIHHCGGEGNCSDEGGGWGCGGNCGGEGSCSDKGGGWGCGGNVQLKLVGGGGSGGGGDWKIDGGGSYSGGETLSLGSLIFKFF